VKSTLKHTAFCFKEEANVAEAWTLHADRALPAEPAQRAVARQIYGEIAALPIVAMHGHVEAADILADEPFGDPAEFFVIPDHYLTRMLLSQGHTAGELGLEGGTADHREVWRLLCANWKVLRGTPSRYWLEHALVEVFGVAQQPSAATADAIYDHLEHRLSLPEYRIRSLFDRFGIEVLSTTDAAESDLAAHTALAAEGWGERVIPTFRPDTVFSLDRPEWAADLEVLAARSGVAITGYDSFLAAIRQRREAFVAAGARASDHSHLSADTTPLDVAEARRLFDAARKAPLSTAEAAAFAATMLFETARMSLDDGLVMQLHPGVVRNHSTPIGDGYGGYDIPVAMEFTRSLRPVLEAFGHDPRFRLILFTVDESVYSRELAPIAGAYPSVRLGAPWWFLDSPGGLARFRELTAETAGFYNTSGFVDDTRAFASIPARHDLARRIDAGYLSKLVVEHRLDLDEAVETAIDLTYRLPLQSYARPTA